MSEALPCLQGLPYTVFQPLYIYGPYAAKDYMGYFLDRLMRNRPVPIPAPGVQLVSLSHVEDIASLMAKASMNPCRPHALSLPTHSCMTRLGAAAAATVSLACHLSHTLQPSQP